MTYLITTRSVNDELYNMASSFWGDAPRKRFTGYNHYKDSLKYLYDILLEPYDYIINIDEDCFVYDFERMLFLIEAMEETNSIQCGMPDSFEWCSHRNNSRFVHNPFFNIFNRKKVSELLVSTTPFTTYHIENDLEVDGCNFHEPFNVFFAAIKKGNRIELDTKQHADGISTILNDFALHSWYSREYNGEHKQRIINLYNEANNMRSIS